MSNIQLLPTKEQHLKSYIFKVVLEQDKWPDEPDSKAVWRAYVPELESKGAATWGYTQEEALRNIQEVVTMLVQDMVECGEMIPLEATNGIQISPEPLVTVTLT